MVYPASSSGAKFFKTADYIPILSTASNLVNLIQKAAFANKDELTVKTDRFYSYIKDKSALRCLLLILLPGFGNLAFGIYDAVREKQLAGKINTLETVITEDGNNKDHMIPLIRNLSSEEFAKHGDKLLSIINSANDSLATLRVLNLNEKDHQGLEVLTTEASFMRCIDEFRNHKRVKKFYKYLVDEGKITESDRKLYLKKLSKMSHYSARVERMLGGKKQFSITDLNNYLSLLVELSVEKNTHQKLVDENFPMFVQNHVPENRKNRKFNRKEDYDTPLIQAVQRITRYPILFEALKKQHPDDENIARLHDHFVFYSELANALMHHTTRVSLYQEPV